MSCKLLTKFYQAKSCDVLMSLVVHVVLAVTLSVPNRLHAF
jgi:hypothetical protein